MRREYIIKLFRGEIHPEDSCEFETEDYEEFTKEFTILYREIKALLPEERQMNLEKLIDAHNAMNGEIVMDAFVNGFKLGMNFTVEGLYSGKK